MKQSTPPWSPPDSLPDAAPWNSLSTSSPVASDSFSHFGVQNSQQFIGYLREQLLELSSKPKGHKNASGKADVLLDALVPIFGLAVITVVAFLILRKNDQHAYAPRTSLAVLNDEEKTPCPAEDGYFSWLSSFMRESDTDLLKRNSLDAYLFLRFLKMTVVIPFVGCCLTWPILFPINATGTGKQRGLNVLAIGNVDDPRRYYAHALVAWVFVGFVMFTITRETLYFINLRQAYLMTPWNTSRLSNRTVMFTDVPKEFLDEDAVRKSFKGVERIWFTAKLSKLKKLVKERDESALKLEQAEVELAKRMTQGLSLTAQLMRKSERPRHRPTELRGRQVDTIDWYRDRLVSVMKEMDDLQHEHGTQPELDREHGMFVEFESMSAAQAAFQMTSHVAPLQMEPRCISTVPSTIIWKNIDMKSWDRLTRGLLALAFILALTVFWTFLTTAIQFLSNLENLIGPDRAAKIPGPILRALTGLLPPLLLAYFVSLVPAIFRYAAIKAGEVSTVAVELRTQEWYFFFQLVQVFFITTVASGLISTIQLIAKEPQSAVRILAKNLPKASNFFMAYFVVYGLGQSTKKLLNIGGYLSTLFMGRLFDKTPRDKYTRYISLPGAKWGSYYPKYTNLAVIAISYSCIAPLVLGFATIGLGCLYLSFRYNLFYVFNPKIDTQGRAYAKALQQLTVGVYTAELCLIGLFSLAIPRDVAAIGPLILVVILTAATIAYHLIMQKVLSPLTHTLPSSALHRYDTGAPGSHDASRSDGHDSAAHDEENSPRLSLSGPIPSKISQKPIALFRRFFEPQKYCSFEAIRSELLKTHLAEDAPELPPSKYERAYLHPSISSEKPVLWIAKDEAGVSRREKEELEREGIRVSDEGAEIGGNGKVIWDKDVANAPVFEQKLYY